MLYLHASFTLLNIGNNNTFQFLQFSNLELPKIGMNTKPAMGDLFELGKIDLITGVSTGGVYHIQIEICITMGDLNGDEMFNVLDIVTLANCVLAENSGS